MREGDIHPLPPLKWAGLQWGYFSAPGLLLPSSSNMLLTHALSALSCSGTPPIVPPCPPGSPLCSCPYNPPKVREEMLHQCSACCAMLAPVVVLWLGSQEYFIACLWYPTRAKDQCRALRIVLLVCKSQGYKSLRKWHNFLDKLGEHFVTPWKASNKSYTCKRSLLWR